MFQCGLFSWNCFIKSNLPSLSNSRELLLLFPSALLSGGFYSQIIQQLRRGKVSQRKKTLARAFFFLWASWVVCVLPYEVIDVFFVKIGYSTYADKPDELVWKVEGMSNQIVDGPLKRFMVVESGARVLKRSWRPGAARPGRSPPAPSGRPDR